MLTDYRKDFKSGGRKFPKPEWDGTNAHPVSYSMGEYVQVYLTVDVEPMNACPETGMIAGRGPDGISFEAKWTVKPGRNRIYAKAKKALALSVQILDFEVIWRTVGLSVKFDFFNDFTKNRLYVTYGKPYNSDPTLDNEVTEKRPEWICSLTKGHTNGHDSVKKVHSVRNAFYLWGPTPRPHWELAERAMRCQCVDLAKFWMLTAEMLGLRTGAVVYLYPKLSKGTKESANPEDRDLRPVKSSNPAHGDLQRRHGSIKPNEELMFIDSHGGWNAYEACYKLTYPEKGQTLYYAGGSGVFATPEEVMKSVCKETHWIYRTDSKRDPARICKDPGPSPAEVWRLW